MIIDDETQDIPEDDIAKDRESAPIIDLSPEPMDVCFYCSGFTNKQQL